MIPLALTARRRLRLLSLLPLLAAILLPSLVLFASSGAAVRILIRNSCPYTLHAFARAGPGPTFNYRLPAKSGKQYIRLEQYGDIWLAGVIWASRTNNSHNGEATQIEFAIGADIGHGVRQDFYDISLVNAYNLPARIKPSKPPGVSGRWCGAPTCKISGLSAFCKRPNFLKGADPACINPDGPGLVATDGTRAFKKACPQAYSYSTDDPSSVYSCKWGTNYEVRFCP